MASHIRVVFVGQGPSGLPVDRTVNVFHFLGAGTFVDDYAAAVAKVDRFYTDLASGQTNPVGSYLAPWVDRDAQLIAYDMDEPPVRVPWPTSMVLPASLGSSSLPNEVAVCLSYEGDPPHTPRRRGRIYLGPLWNGAGASTPGSVTDDGRPGATLMQDLGDAAALLAGADSGPAWVIRSTKPAVNYVNIVSGWVDNAFDTQRRRGVAATTRNTWVEA